MAKALDTSTHGYSTQLNDAEKKSVIAMLKTLIGAKFEGSARIGAEQYNEELQETEAEYERGEYLPHEEFLKQIKKW